MYDRPYEMHYELYSDMGKQLYISYRIAGTLHSDKISHLTYTLLTCLQIIKHNIAYMSAVGAEYAEVYFAT